MSSGAVSFTGYVRKGRLEVRRRTVLRDMLARMRDGEVQITIERIHATRSHAQNRYYWGVVVELMSEHTGYAPDEVHQLLKAKFLPKRLAMCDGNGEVKDEFVIGGTTTTLNKVEFGEYMEAIRQWAGEYLDVFIPDPDTGTLWTGAPRQHAESQSLR